MTAVGEPYGWGETPVVGGEPTFAIHQGATTTGSTADANVWSSQIPLVPPSQEARTDPAALLACSGQRVQPMVVLQGEQGRSLEDRQVPVIDHGWLLLCHTSSLLNLMLVQEARILRSTTNIIGERQ